MREPDAKLTFEQFSELTFEQIEDLAGSDRLDVETLRRLCLLLGAGKDRPKTWDAAEAHVAILLLAQGTASSLLLDEVLLQTLAGGIDHGEVGASQAALALLEHPLASERLVLGVIGRSADDDLVRSVAAAGWLAPAVMTVSDGRRVGTWLRDGAGEEGLRDFGRALEQLSFTERPRLRQLLCDVGWAWEGDADSLIGAVRRLAAAVLRQPGEGRVSVSDLVEAAHAGTLTPNEVDALVDVLVRCLAEDDDLLLVAGAAMPHLRRHHLGRIASSARETAEALDLARALMAHLEADESLAVQIVNDSTFDGVAPDLARAGWLAPAAHHLVCGGATTADPDRSEAQREQTELMVVRLEALLGGDRAARQAAAALGVSWPGSLESLAETARDIAEPGASSC